ncbi:MAG TPA: glycosyltransferase family 4 protein [Gammaproteobacteria bacterium]
MHVAHVNLARGFRGGERQTQLLIEALSELGIQQTLVARADSPLQQKLRGVSGLNFYPLGKPYWKYIPGLHGLQPDLVHAHEAKAAQWALLNYWLYKTPYVLTRRISRSPRNFLLTRAVYRNAAAVVALSTAIKDSLRYFPLRREVTVIPSMYASLPVDRQRAEVLHRNYPGRFLIGHIGALVDRQKGQSVLIAAAKMLRNRYPEFQFLLVGEGEDREKLMRLADTQAKVEFIGFVDDVGTWIEVFDLFVFPSLEEGLGSTLLDVMQHKKPIVASFVGGIPEVIEHGHNGLLVPPGDAEKLAAAIEEMYLNVPLREKCVTGGLQQLERYSPRRIAGCYHNLYKSVNT